MCWSRRCPCRRKRQAREQFPLASTMFTIKMGKGGLPAAPGEPDDTPLVAAPPVVATVAAAGPAMAPAAVGPGHKYKAPA